MVEEKWIEVQSSRDKRTERLKVPGGWLYVVTERGEYSTTIINQLMCFVPAK